MRETKGESQNRGCSEGGPSSARGVVVLQDSWMYAVPFCSVPFRAVACRVVSCGSYLAVVVIISVCRDIVF